MTSLSSALKAIVREARPLIEQQVDIAEQVAALRDAATEKGLDWSQIKALLKAMIQDERDETGDGKRVQKIIDRAEHASAYADMLGLAKMNENIFSDGLAEPALMQGSSLPANTKSAPIPPSPEPTPSQATAKADDAPSLAASSADPFEPPAFLRDRPQYVLRPHCLKPDNCGSYGAKHCGSCERAARESEAA